MEVAVANCVRVQTGQRQNGHKYYAVFPFWCSFLFSVTFFAVGCQIELPPKDHLLVAIMASSLRALAIRACALHPIRAVRSALVLRRSFVVKTSCKHKLIYFTCIEDGFQLNLIWHC